MLNFIRKLPYLQEKSLSYSVRNKDIGVRIEEIPHGPSENSEFLFHKENNILKIYDKLCDHAGGELNVKNNVATCPLHGWKLDLQTGEYTNAQCTKKPLEIVDTNIKKRVNVQKKGLTLNKEHFKQNKCTKVQFINHACLLFSLGNVQFATDPWVIGSAFCNGWWLSKKSPDDVFAKLNRCDFIYISHNHPDHLHEKTLEHIRKDMPIITAKFLSESCSKLLRRQGFTNILEMDFNTKLVDNKSEIALTVLKSGDFRDDSGLLVEHGTFSCLLTVDSNYLNFGKLPEVDLLCSSFAGGASGFPLCFDNYSEIEKSSIILRNKGAIKAMNVTNINITKPKYFLPYAGFFTEKLARDRYIKENNSKNTIENYEQICHTRGCQLLNINSNNLYEFQGPMLAAKKMIRYTPIDDNETAPYMVDFTHIDSDQAATLIIDYFSKCQFTDDLILELITTNDTFTRIFEDVCIDFRSDPPTISKSITTRDCRNLQIKVRRNELLDVITNHKPWEDLSIGFQCRIQRSPNVYNSKFWFHFTNIYVK